MAKADKCSVAGVHMQQGVKGGSIQFSEDQNMQRLEEKPVVTGQ